MRGGSRLRWSTESLVGEGGRSQGEEGIQWAESLVGEGGHWAQSIGGERLVLLKYLH